MSVDAAAVDAFRQEIQGNVVEPYKLAHVRHLVMRVTHPEQARRALAAMLDPFSERPSITSAAASHPEEATGPFVNVGFSFLGLKALGVPNQYSRLFPPEFQAGMVARAGLLGDVDASAPEHWVDGLQSPAVVHVMFTVYGRSAEEVAEAADQVLDGGRRGFAESAHFDGEALVQTGPGQFAPFSEAPPDVYGASAYTRHRGEHFGFRDGLSQPRFAGFRGDRPAPGDPREPLGVVLLGHPTLQPIAVPVPPYPLGHNGAFNAFRVLAQDVAGFRRYVAQVAKEQGIAEELLRAKMCGRWPNGIPLELADSADIADKVLAENNGRAPNAFDFSDDQDGAVCPVGSHIRRTNPRAAHIVQRPANRARRLVRRGMPFGPWLKQGHEHEQQPRERGLLGSFLCASLSTQFESMQFDWINLGLLDPSITGRHDPLVGANDPASSTFTFHAGDQWRTVRGLPRFVETMGGAYFFIPSMEALVWLGSAGWAKG